MVTMWYVCCCKAFNSDINVTSYILFHLPYSVQKFSSKCENITYAFQYLHSRSSVAHHGCGMRKYVYLVPKRTQILESYKMLICYYIDCICNISGSMTLVKIVDTAFQYPRISVYQYRFGQRRPPSQTIYQN